MTEYKKGQRVKVEFEAEVSSLVGGSDACVLVNGDWHHWLYPTGLKVTVLDPTGWPPQVGDVWKGNGLEWFATGDDHVTPEVDCDGEAAAWHVSDFRDLNPYLVRRRGE